MSELEEKIDGWFYKHATKEPDGTHTLVMHEVHDNGARDDLLALIEAEANRRVVEARKEQVMQDELSLSIELPITDESQLIEWREATISQLEQKGEQE